MCSTGFLHTAVFQLRLVEISYIKIPVKSLIALVVFGAAFAFVEASVVYYLRTLFEIPAALAVKPTVQPVFNLGLIAFLPLGTLVLPSPAIMQAETLREFATIVMLGAVSYLAAPTLRRRLGAFFVAFAVWDIFYYVFLHVLTGWPPSLFAVDVFFLIPVPWVGPVITAVCSSVLLFITGIML